MDMHLPYCFRLEMEREHVVAGPLSSHNDSGFVGNGRMTDRERIQQLAMKTSFYALRNNILEEIRSGNEAVVRDLLCRHMKQFITYRFSTY